MWERLAALLLRLAWAWSRVPSPDRLPGKGVAEPLEQGTAIALIRCPVHAGEQPWLQAREPVHEAAGVAQRRIRKRLPRDLARFPDGRRGVGQWRHSAAELAEEIATQQVVVGLVVEIAAFHR